MGLVCWRGWPPLTAAVAGFASVSRRLRPRPVHHCIGGWCWLLGMAPKTRDAVDPWDRGTREPRCQMFLASSVPVLVWFREQFPYRVLARVGWPRCKMAGRHNAVWPGVCWSRGRDLNPRPAIYETAALAAELPRLGGSGGIRTH